MNCGTQTCDRRTGDQAGSPTERARRGDYDRLNNKRRIENQTDANLVISMVRYSMSSRPSFRSYVTNPFRFDLPQGVIMFLTLDDVFQMDLAILILQVQTPA